MKYNVCACIDKVGDLRGGKGVRLHAENVVGKLLSILHQVLNSTAHVGNVQAAVQYAIRI